MEVGSILEAGRVRLSTQTEDNKDNKETAQSFSLLLIKSQTVPISFYGSRILISE